MNLIRKLLVTGLGTGYLWPSGTWGSAGTCLVFLACSMIVGDSAAHANARFGFLSINIAMLAVAAASSIACVALGAFAEKTFGRKDPKQCTIDEWAGQAVALLLLPARGGMAWLLTAVGVAFVAFRFFDITKPPPARQMEKLPLGWGILLDDLVAGVYANIVAQIVLRWIAPMLPLFGTTT